MAVPLIETDDDFVSLEEALALIDACEASSSERSLESDSVASSSDFETPSSDDRSTTAPISARVDGKRRATAINAARVTADASDSADEIASSTKVAGPKRRKKRNPSSSSTELQRRKRAELIELREEVGQLEAHLDHLRRMHLARSDGETSGPICSGASVGQNIAALSQASGESTVTSTEASSVWQQLAMVQARGRQSAELTNKKLKAILNNQQKLNRAFRTLLGKRSILQGIELVFNSEPIYRSPSPIDNSAVVISQLGRQVDAMHLEMAPVVPPTLPKSVSCSTEFKRRHDGGLCIEMVTTTPMNSSFHDAAEMAWRNLTIKHDYKGKSYRFMRADEHSLEKDFVMVFQDSGSHVAVRGLQFMRKFVESDRVVMVKTNLILLPTNGLQFRDRVWTTVTPAVTGGTVGSVVESRYSVFAEVPSGGDATDSTDRVYTQEFVLRNLSTGMRFVEQKMQSALLTEDLRRHFTRKFIESDRIVIVRTSVMFLPTNGLQFRDRTWITISKLDSDNGLASVVESRYQVNAETVDGAVGVATSSEDLSSTQEYVMQQLSGHLRAFDQTLQTELLTVESSQRQLLGFKC